jgi:hypothetical protein
VVSHDFTNNIAFVMYKTEYEYFLYINTSMHNFVHGSTYLTSRICNRHRFVCPGSDSVLPQVTIKSKYTMLVTINCDYPPLTLVPYNCPSPKVITMTPWWHFVLETYFLSLKQLTGTIVVGKNIRTKGSPYSWSKEHNLWIGATQE